MRTHWSDIGGWLLFVLAPLALGVLLDGAAGDRPGLRRITQLVIVYGLAMSWLRLQPSMHTWQRRIVRAIRSRRYARCSL